ncbi:type II toxin-antitoxin system VapC family toxin [Rhodopila globiformis]|uniref:type II toxin-antitoxin system VapC family toxin n=1 Tax=Rhodopila globiformis TaxID=1071 RepID=UPI0026A023F7
MYGGECRACHAERGTLLTYDLDTSLLVAALTREAATARVQVWLDQQASAALPISDWIVTEFASALSMKIRMHQLRTEDRANAMSVFTRLKAESLIVVPVARAHFLAAARFAEQHALGLRAGDALHVAIAAEQGATICTLDKRLAEAAVAPGIGSELA